MPPAQPSRDWQRRVPAPLFFGIARRRPKAPWAVGTNATVVDNPPPSEILQGKVLYIEDLPINVVVVEDILSKHPGIELLHAANGLDGIRLVREQQPDFVLLDMHLPDISGLEVVRRLSEEIAERDLLVTLLTVDSFTMDVVKALSLGAYEYIVKPINADRLEAAVRRALTGGRSARRGTVRHRG